MLEVPAIVRWVGDLHKQQPATPPSPTSIHYQPSVLSAQTSAPGSLMARNKTPRRTHFLPALPTTSLPTHHCCERRECREGSTCTPTTQYPGCSTSPPRETKKLPTSPSSWGWHPPHPRHHLSLSDLPLLTPLRPQVATPAYSRHFP